MYGARTIEIAQNSGAVACQFLVCYFTAHSHLLISHFYPHKAGGDTPALEYRRFRSHISKLVTSRRFQKWCSGGVVSAFLLCKTIDFTGLSGILQDISVADKSADISPFLVHTLL